MPKYPVILFAAAAALLAGVTYKAGAVRPTVLPTLKSPVSAGLPKALCPRGTLPDRGVCIPVPRPVPASPEPSELVPLRPDRAADYTRYRTPVAGTPRAARPEDGAPERSAAMAVPGAPGSEVRAVPLEGQLGNAEVLVRGSLIGSSLVLLVTAGASRREYLVLVGNLESPVPLERGATVPESAVIGRAGAKPILWAARLLRPGVDARSLTPNDVVGESSAVWVDPRNVLPLREGTSF